MKLTPELLLAAYSQGVFPMADARDGEIGWFMPESRGVLELDRLKVSRSLAKVVDSGIYTITVNTAFASVINLCAALREETWISHEIERAYTELHHLGYAHSVEVWQDELLAGGLYGVSIGGAFFGESMFHKRRDASKVALVYLVRRLRERGFVLLDTQYITSHLASLGAVEIPREEYMLRLKLALNVHTSFA